MSKNTGLQYARSAIISSAGTCLLKTIPISPKSVSIVVIFTPPIFLSLGASDNALEKIDDSFCFWKALANITGCSKGAPESAICFRTLSTSPCARAPPAAALSLVEIAEHTSSFP